jgi:RNA polymerase sigma factor (sigma-70 family)
VEGHALTEKRLAAPRGASPLLRLASDERLVALTRGGNQGAFEVIVARYQGRLLSFCARIVGSREDAEDVLQEAFAAAFSALLADRREINLRPWLYRIARNRSLNHLRRHSAIGVDSMDVHFAEMGISTSDKVFKREEFKLLVEDIAQLPETQRTALLLREMDGMSYEQIAGAMDTTVPGIKSLLVRARVGLAEANEARKLSCEEVRQELGEVAEGLVTLSQPVRRHLKGCQRCSDFRAHLRANNRTLAALAPFGPLLLLKHFLATKLGLGAGGASAGAGGSAALAGGGAAAGGSTAGAVTASAVAAKALATIAAAAIVTVVAVGRTHPKSTPPPAAQTQAAVAQTVPAAPTPTPVHHTRRHRRIAKLTTTAAAQPTSVSALAATSPVPAATPAPSPAQTTTAPSSEEVTTTTVFPGASATGSSGPTSATGASGSTTTSTAPATQATGTSGSTGTTAGSGATSGAGAAGATGLSGTGASGSTGTTGATP